MYIIISPQRILVVHMLVGFFQKWEVTICMLQFGSQARSQTSTFHEGKLLKDFKLSNTASFLAGNELHRPLI